MAFFDSEHLNQLRADAKFNHIDTSRARIERGANDTFMVLLDASQVDITSVLGVSAPRTILCLSAGEAEGELLTQCLRVQRAERLKVRQGRTFGWSTDQIVRRPLTDDELADYKAEVQHQATRARLVEQLNEALAEQRQQAADKAAVDGLVERYGLTDKPKPTVPTAHKADPATEHLYATRQVPSRKGARK